MDGFIFCCSYNQGDLIVCNPILREYILIPSPRPSSVRIEPFRVRMESYGFGVSKEHLEYKVVRISYEELSCHRCQVYTVGTGDWREISGCPPLAIGNREGVLQNGNIHWLARDDSQWILYFNLETELFGKFLAPVDLDPQDKTLSILGEVLCLCSNTHIHIYLGVRRWKILEEAVRPSQGLFLWWAPSPHQTV